MDLMQEQASSAMIQMQLNVMSSTCFDYCVPEPGNRLTAAETTCIRNCTSKFLRAFDVVVHAFNEQGQSQ